MKTHGGLDVYVHVFLTSALFGGEWSASRPGRFSPEERSPGTHWIGDTQKQGYWVIVLLYVLTISYFYFFFILVINLF
jgi:hypothetical protein